MKFLYITLLATCVAMLFVTSNSYAQNVEVNKNNPFVGSSLALLRLDDPIGQNAVAKSLMNKGVTDERIYQRLVELINQYSTKGSYKHLSWITIALGASGDVQYQPVLEELAKNGKGRSKVHANRALKELKTQQRINSIAAKNNYVGTSKLVEKNAFVSNALAKLKTNDPVLQTQVAKSLVQMGITEEKIYTRISELVTLYSTDDDDINDRYIAWLILGLAYSGDNAYRPLIENLPDKVKNKIKKHAARALKILSEQVVLNPILANEDLYSGREKWQSIREANLILFSEEYKTIKKIAEISIVTNTYDPYVFDAMNQRILSDYKIESADKKKIDAYAYWTKAFTFYPSIEYLDTVKKAAESAGNKKLRKYASTVLRRSGIRLNEVEDIIKSVDYNGEPIGSVSIVFLGESWSQLKNTENLIKPNGSESNENINDSDWEEDEKSVIAEKVASFKKMALKAEILRNLQYNNKYDPTSKNSLIINITSYRVRSRAAKAIVGPIPLGADFLSADVQLNVENNVQQNFTVRSVIAPRVFKNQSGAGEIPLRNDFMIKLTSIFK